MKNYLVVHKVNGNTVSRNDFGGDIAKAVKFSQDIVDNCYQVGKHLIIIKEEFTGELLGDYTQEFFNI